MEEAKVYELRIKEPKECTKAGEHWVVAGVVCPELGFDKPVLILFDPKTGTVTVRAECGCSISERIGPMLVDLSRQLAQGHRPDSTTGALH